MRVRRAHLGWMAGLAIAVCLSGAGVGRPNLHRMPRVHVADEAVPPDGWDVRYADQFHALARHVGSRTRRIEVAHGPSGLHTAGHERVDSGVGVVLEPGTLLTTARFLVDGRDIVVLEPTGERQPGLVRRLDQEAGFALVTFEHRQGGDAPTLRGFAPLPTPAEPGAASEVFVPTQAGGIASSVRVAAALEQGDTLFLSGLLANGIPAFDSKGRLVAMAERPTPDRTRSVARSGVVAERWLESAQENGSRGSSPREPGP